MQVILEAMARRLVTANWNLIDPIHDHLCLQEGFVLRQNDSDYQKEPQEKNVDHFFELAATLKKFPLSGFLFFCVTQKTV